MDECSEQAQHLERVALAVAPAITAFCRRNLGREFHSADLLGYVRAVVPHVAPDSPGRILRHLRQRGDVGYTLVSRGEARYRVDWVI